MNYQKVYNTLATQSAEKTLQMYFMIINGDLIGKRREELLTPIKEQDDNIGGSHVHSNQSLTELTAIKLTEDRQLKEYQSIVDKVQNVLQWLYPEELEVIEQYYNFNNYSKTYMRSHHEVSKLTNIDIEYCKKIRQKVLKHLSFRNGVV